MTAYHVTYFDTEGNILEERALWYDLRCVAEAAAKANMADIPAAVRYELS